MNLGRLAAIRNAWLALQTRERRVIAGGGALLALVLFYAFVWAPARQDIRRLRELVPRERAQLAVMRTQALEVTRLRAAGAVGGGDGNLLTRVEQTAVARGLRQAISRMEPDGGHGVRLSLEHVDFNALVAWLADLQSHGGIHVESATIEAQSTPGQVGAVIVLSSGTGT